MIASLRASWRLIPRIESVMGKTAIACGGLDKARSTNGGTRRVLQKRVSGLVVRSGNSDQGNSDQTERSDGTFTCDETGLFGDGRNFYPSQPGPLDGDLARPRANRNNLIREILPHY